MKEIENKFYVSNEKEIEMEIDKVVKEKFKDYKFTKPKPEKSNFLQS